MVRLMASKREIPVPEGVTVEVSARHVKVSGPRGKLERAFKHAKVDIYLSKNEEGATTVVVEKHFDAPGVCPFPINANIVGGGDCIELRNFLGEKRVRKIDMLDGVKIVRSADVKDELVLTGNNIENVSRTCALINQSCLVKNKDIRKFLDGIYISERGTIATE
eukprot:jgi/Tetstr1/460313/TSEL_005613.t1